MENHWGTDIFGIMEMSTPVFLLAGFLGSGKTTLLNHLLIQSASKRKLAIVINEFGKIPIDGDVVRSHGFDVQEIKGGCVCCTLRADIFIALQAIRERIKPDAIIMETSGLAVPRDIVSDLKDPALRGKLRHGGTIILVNASTYEEWSERLFIINEQLKDATCILLNKCDLVDEMTLERVTEKIRTFIPSNVPLHRCTHGSVNPDLILSPHTDSELSREKRQQHHHDSTDGFVSLEYSFTHDIPYHALETFFKAHGPSLVRAKGLVRTNLGSLLIQFSTNGLDVNPFQNTHPDSRLVLIGLSESIQQVKKDADRLFSAKGSSS
jgi:G3E family GTPase